MRKIFSLTLVFLLVLYTFAFATFAAASGNKSTSIILHDAGTGKTVTVTIDLGTAEAPDNVVYPMTEDGNSGKYKTLDFGDEVSVKILYFTINGVNYNLGETIFQQDNEGNNGSGSSNYRYSEPVTTTNNDTPTGGGNTEQPGGGDTEQPGGGDTEQPGGDDTEQPGGGDTEQPGGGDTEQPGGGDTEQPTESNNTPQTVINNTSNTEIVDSTDEPTPLSPVKDKEKKNIDIDYYSALTKAPTTDEVAIVEDLEIEETPLGSMLPQTGQVSPEFFYGIGSVVTALGVYMKKKK